MLGPPVADELANGTENDFVPIGSLIASSISAQLSSIVLAIGGRATERLMNVDKEFLKIAEGNLAESHPSVRDFVKLLESEIRKLEREVSHQSRNVQYLTERLAFAARRAQDLERKHGESSAWDWNADINGHFNE